MLAMNGFEVRGKVGGVGEVSRHDFHDHADVRRLMIAAALADADQPIVVLGDSVTEMAPLPRQLCEHPVINAGVGGMNRRRPHGREIGRYRGAATGWCFGPRRLGLK